VIAVLRAIALLLAFCAVACVVGAVCTAVYEFLLQVIARRRARRSVDDARRAVTRGFISRRAAARTYGEPKWRLFGDGFSIRPRAEWWTWPPLEPDPDPVDARVLRARDGHVVPTAVDGSLAVNGRVRAAAPLDLDLCATAQAIVLSIFVNSEPSPIASYDGGRSWFWWGFTPRCGCGCNLAYGAIDGVGAALGVTCPACQRRHLVGEAS
jgi:hypothetical protein